MEGGENERQESLKTYPEISFTEIETPEGVALSAITEHNGKQFGYEPLVVSKSSVESIKARFRESIGSAICELPSP